VTPRYLKKKKLFAQPWLEISLNFGMSVNMRNLVTSVFSTCTRLGKNRTVKSYETVICTRPFLYKVHKDRV